MRVYRQLGRADRIPAGDKRFPFAFRRMLCPQARMQADLPGSARVFGIGEEGFGHRSGRFRRTLLRQITVAQSPGPPQDDIGITADPDGNRLCGQRVDARFIDGVELALDIHQVAGPELAQNRDLFFAAGAARLEIDAERAVFDLVPTDADAHAEASAGEQIDLGRLFRHQRRLPLGQDQDAGHESDRLGESRHPREEREGLVEHVLVIVGSAAFPAGPLWIGAQHVVISQNMMVAHAFSRLREVAQHKRIGADLRLGEYNSVLHD